MKGDILRMLSKFHSAGKFVKRLNATFIGFISQKIECLLSFFGVGKFFLEVGNFFLEVGSSLEFVEPFPSHLLLVKDGEG